MGLLDVSTVAVELKQVRRLQVVTGHTSLPKSMPGRLDVQLAWSYAMLHMSAMFQINQII